MAPVLYPMILLVQLDQLLNRFKQSEDKLCRMDDLATDHVSVALKHPSGMRAWSALSALPVWAKC